MTNRPNISANNFELFTRSFMDYIEKLWSDERLSELEKYIPDNGDARWNMEKVK